MTDFTDFTFTIPFRLDSDDRRRNLQIIVAHLLRHFRTRIILAEHDRESRYADFWRPEWPAAVEHCFIPSGGGLFERARAINAGVMAARTPYVVLQDADALVPTAQYRALAGQLRGDVLDLGFPFENRVVYVPNDDVAKVAALPDADVLSARPYPRSTDDDEIVSLAVFVNRERFVECGLMNEHFRAWGYEDVEFFARAQTLGLRAGNVDGLVYHLDHYRDDSYWGYNPHFDDNRREYEKVCAMSRKALAAYIETWPWRRASLPQAGAA